MIERVSCWTGAATVGIVFADEIAYAHATTYVVGVVLATGYAARTVHVRWLGYVVNKRLQLIGFVFQRRYVTIEKITTGAIYIVDGVSAPLHFVVDIPCFFEFHATVQIVTTFFSGLIIKFKVIFIKKFPFFTIKKGISIKYLNS